MCSINQPSSAATFAAALVSPTTSRRACRWRLPSTSSGNHAVYLWQCDRDGAYSLYNIPGENFLRGMGISNASGRIEFQTIFPGCYGGRWPHVHVEVFASREAAVRGAMPLLVSQFSIPAETCTSAYEAQGYAQSKAAFARTSLARDYPFGDNSPAEMRAITLAMQGNVTAGYRGHIRLAVA
jgi:hypothetical protein